MANKVFKNPLNQSSDLQDDSVYFGDSDLWTAATSGDTEFLDNYYKGGGKTNQKFNGFGRTHSVLLGAARNNRPEIVKILESYGEKPLSPDEEDELAEYKFTWNLENARKTKKTPRGFIANKDGTYAPREYTDEDLRNAYHTTLNHLRNGGKLDDSFYNRFPEFSTDAILSAVGDYLSSRGRNENYNEGFKKGLGGN